MQLTSPSIAVSPAPKWPLPSARLVDELRRDVHGVRDRVTYGRLPVDRLLAPPHLVLGRRALDRHRIADVADAVADRLVVAEDAPQVEVRLHLDVELVEGYPEIRGVGGNPGGDAAGQRRHERLDRVRGAVDATEHVGVVDGDGEAPCGR